MTTEIAIMNKSAIALAADSAVTYSKPNGQLKIYNTVNKLFALSKYQPVGIMIFDNAELMGIPWETIIKIYRSKLGNKRFRRLQQYAEHLLSFFIDNSALFSADNQSTYYDDLIRTYFSQIRDDALNECNAHIKANKEIEEFKVEQFFSDRINSFYKNLESHKDVECLPNGFSGTLVNQYKGLIEKSRVEIFRQVPLSTDSQRKLESIAALLITKDFFPNTGNSGVVIAGFGESEPFPSLHSYTVQGIVGGKLKYKTYRGGAITLGNDAQIIPFAQDEMVHTFMQGVDPLYEHFVMTTMDSVITKYYFDPINSDSTMTEQEKKDLIMNLKQIQSTALKEVREKVKEYKREQYINPIVEAVAALPKDELAAMAESLVNLTILKRKVSMTLETVGGAIDVAVISKGDGLIWIKRKHYFNQELNRTFMANYFKKDEEEV